MKFKWYLLFGSFQLSTAFAGDYDVQFKAFNETIFLEADTIFREGDFVTFTYRIDVPDTSHLWSKLYRTMRSQCSANYIQNVSVIAVIRATNEYVDLTGNQDFGQYEANGYRDLMTRYACKLDIAPREALKMDDGGWVPPTSTE